jgi:hypothetical protein
MNYKQQFEKAYQYVKKHPGLLTVTVLLMLAPWLQTGLQGTIDWTGNGISLQWTTLPDPYTLIIIGTLTILWLTYRLIRKFDSQQQNF